MDLGVNVCDLEKFPKETTHISHHVFGHRKLFLVNFRLGIVIVRNDNYQSGMRVAQIILFSDGMNDFEESNSFSLILFFSYLLTIIV